MYFFQPVEFIFTVVTCAAELGHVGRRSAHVCHVNPAFDACFHIRRDAQKKATDSCFLLRCDLLTTFCTYENNNNSAVHKLSVKREDVTQLPDSR